MGHDMIRNGTGPTARLDCTCGFFCTAPGPTKRYSKATTTRLMRLWWEHVGMTPPEAA